MMRFRCNFYKMIFSWSLDELWSIKPSWPKLAFVKHYYCYWKILCFLLFGFMRGGEGGGKEVRGRLDGTAKKVEVKMEQLEKIIHRKIIYFNKKKHRRIR